VRPVHAVDNNVMEYRSISACTPLVYQRQKQNKKCDYYHSPPASIWSSVRVCRPTAIIVVNCLLMWADSSFFCGDYHILYQKHTYQKHFFFRFFRNNVYDPVTSHFSRKIQRSWFTLCRRKDGKRTEKQRVKYVQGLWGITGRESALHLMYSFLFPNDIKLINLFFILCGSGFDYVVYLVRFFPLRNAYALGSHSTRKDDVKMILNYFKVTVFKTKTSDGLL
jgi:hypothetical protein